MTEQTDIDEHDRDEPRYESLDAIKEKPLFTPLRHLLLLNDDMYLRSQAHNLSIVDQFLNELEYKTLHDWFQNERTPPEAYFLSAQSQMWIFAAYELLRTWRQRAKDMIRMAQNGGLESKLHSLIEKDYGYVHFGNDIRIEQIQTIIKQPELIDELQKQLSHIHIPFRRLEFIRVSMAKHEVSGRSKTPALGPGTSRLNMWCGSLDYELENGKYSMGTISRRDVADSIRYLDLTSSPPSGEHLKSFDNYLYGKIEDD